MRKSPFHFPALFLVIVSVLALTCADAWARPELFVRWLRVENLPANRICLLGGQMEVVCLIINSGDAPTGDRTITYYLSRDEHISRADQEVLTITRGSLAPGAEEELGTTVTLPDDYPRGNAHIGVLATCPEDTWPDWDNTEATSIRIAAPRPDLVVRLVDATDGAYPPGGQIVVKATIANTGGAASDSYTVDFFVNERRIGTASRPALAVDGTDTFETTCTFPKDLPDGQYAISATARCANDDDVNSNTGRDGSLVDVRLLPDLAAQTIDASNGTYHPGDQIHVHTLIKNIGDRPSAVYSVSYYMSDDATITTNDCRIGVTQRNALQPGEQHSFDMTCQLPVYVPAGQCYIGGILTTTNDGNALNNTGMDKTPVTVVHPPGYVCGRVTYEDIAAWPHPIRYARVKICTTDSDNNPLNDRVLAETATDGDGNFGVVLAPDPTAGPLIHVKVFTEGVSGAYPGATSAICTMTDDVLKAPYSVKSSSHPYPVETSATINMPSADIGGAFMIFDSIVEGFHKTKVLFHVELPAIRVYSPSSDGGTYYSPGQGIWVKYFDCGDRDVILHEYGHYVADSTGFGLGSVGLNPFHYWNMDLRSYPYFRTNDEARNLAFREAWATLFAVAVQYGDTGYPYGGDAKYQDEDVIAGKTMMLNLESDTYAARTPGEYFENMNCCALWDVFDDQNDTRNFQDTLSDPGLVKIWTTVRDHKPKDILDFWNSWFENYEYRKEMTSIFGNHQMSFKYPKGSGTVATFESGQFDGFAWTTRGDAWWTVVSDASHQGTYSARAGSIQAGQSSTLEVKITCEAGRIGFWYKLSTEMGGDMLNFYIDGVRQNNWSGEKDWQRIDFAVQAGPHTFTWTYTKDGSVTRGADTVWLDDIEFPVW